MGYGTFVNLHMDGAFAYLGGKIQLFACIVWSLCGVVAKSLELKLSCNKQVNQAK